MYSKQHEITKFKLEWEKMLTQIIAFLQNSQSELRNDLNNIKDDWEVVDVEELKSKHNQLVFQCTTLLNEINKNVEIHEKYSLNKKLKELTDKLKQLNCTLDFSSLYSLLSPNHALSYTSWLLVVSEVNKLNPSKPISNLLNTIHKELHDYNKDLWNKVAQQPFSLDKIPLNFTNKIIQDLSALISLIKKEHKVKDKDIPYLDNFYNNIPSWKNLPNDVKTLIDSNLENKIDKIHLFQVTKSDYGFFPKQTPYESLKNLVLLSPNNNKEKIKKILMTHSELLLQEKPFKDHNDKEFKHIFEYIIWSKDLSVLATVHEFVKETRNEKLRKELYTFAFNAVKNFNFINLDKFLATNLTTHNDYATLFNELPKCLSKNLMKGDYKANELLNCRILNNHDSFITTIEQLGTELKDEKKETWWNSFNPFK